MPLSVWAKDLLCKDPSSLREGWDRSTFASTSCKC